MGFWIKEYEGNKLPVWGTDEDIAAGKASWSKSPLENMVSARVDCGEFVLEVLGKGEYWHSDTYEIVMGEKIQTRTKRRIEKRVREEEKDITLHMVDLEEDYTGTRGLIANFLGFPCWPYKVASERSGGHISLSDRVGQWLILEYNLVNHFPSWYFSKNRI